MIKIIINIFLIVFMMPFSGFADNLIKKPNVAGQFYSGNPQQLSSQIQSFLDTSPLPEESRHVEILIAPHAGYIYSGHIAARAFKYASPNTYKTVIILAPSHYYGFSEAAVWDKGGYETPLGTLEVDEDFTARLISGDPLFIVDPAAFEREHALEVELPFIRTVFPDAKIVPVIMGQMGFDACEQAARAINEVIGDRKDVLVVISSDMSHFHDDATARRMDAEAIKTIEAADAKRLWQQCALRRLELCGFIPVTTAMLLAKERGLELKVLTYGNSGDVTGDKSNVVGYSSIVFYRGKDTGTGQVEQGEGSLTLGQKRRLIEIAKQTIDLYVREKRIFDVTETDPRLQKVEGAFVTIHKRGKLRGCIGNIIGQQPLFLTVRDMAVSASANDPRFNPVLPDELKDIDIEVSVLSTPYRAKSPDEIQMGVHGVIVRRGWHQGVFLPQVATETGWDRETFLSQLCAHKAGLPPDAWRDPGTELNIFTATVFSEHDVHE
ncbi:MAG: AmmeMemoRadiSam system protein B [Candidatus Omnitrophota bacterium]